MKYLTYLNSGCKSICDNMLHSAKSVGIAKEQFLIVAFDRAIYDYYGQQGYEVELFEDVPEETYHNWTWDPNSKFRALVKHKWTLLKKYFTTNKPLVWLDSDVVFLKNPEEILKTISVPTFQIDYPAACICTGLMFFPDSSISDEILNILGAQNTEDDQLVCNNLVNSNTNIKSNIKFFDLNLFPNGGYFYDAKGTTIEKAVMLHCNYIVGLENKINRLKQCGAWFV